MKPCQTFANLFYKKKVPPLSAPTPLAVRRYVAAAAEATASLVGRSEDHLGDSCGTLAFCSARKARRRRLLLLLQ